MTKREMINRYLSSIGCSLTQGDSCEPILPFLLGDCIYTIFNKDIAPLQLERKEQVIRSHWCRNYTMFNLPFFQAVGVSSYEQIYDVMDDFEGFISVNLMQLRSALMLLLQDVPFERRGVIVSALLCHVLAQAAQCAWGNVYRHRKVMGHTKDGRSMTLDRPDKNRHLDAINDDAFRLANIWHTSIEKALVDPNKTKDIPVAIKALCRKIYRWVETN